MRNHGSFLLSHNPAQLLRWRSGGVVLQLLGTMGKEQEKAEADLKNQEGRKELEVVKITGGVECIRKQADTACKKFEHGFTSTNRGRGVSKAHTPRGDHFAARLTRLNTVTPMPIRLTATNRVSSGLLVIMSQMAVISSVTVDMLPITALIPVVAVSVKTSFLKVD